MQLFAQLLTYGTRLTYIEEDSDKNVKKIDADSFW